MTVSPLPAPPSIAPPPAPRLSTDQPRGPAPPPGWAPPPPAMTSWWPWPTLQVSWVMVRGLFLVEALMRGCILKISFFFFVALMPTFLYFLSTCKSLNSSNSGIEIYFSHLLLTTKDKYLLSWKLKDVSFWIDLISIVQIPHKTCKFLIWCNQSYWIHRPLMTSFSGIYRWEWETLNEPTIGKSNPKTWSKDKTSPVIGQSNI